jgi:CheY-like chemotaxis protein
MAENPTVHGSTPPSDAGPRPELVADAQHLVLVVDDDDAVRALEKRVLERHGYTVAQAATAGRALSMLKAGLRPDLVIADLELPGMPGEAMVQRIREANPDQKILYVTGNIHRVMRPGVRSRTGVLFLDKPFTASGLLQAVSHLLTATADTAGATPPAASTDDNPPQREHRASD